MNRPLKLVVVTAGLSKPSSTRLLADRLAEATVRHQPADVRMIELRDLATAVAHHMVTGFPGADLRDALDAVAEADGVIAVTPVFSASYSGLFKSFFDVMDSTALDGKPLLIAATGGTDRHSLVLEHAMRPLFAYLRALVMPTAVYAASADWGSGGDARTGALADRVDRAAGELAGQLRTSRAAAADADTHTGGSGGTGGGAEPAEEVLVPFAEQLAALRG